MWGRRLAAMLALYTGKVVTPEVNVRECISGMPLPSVNKAGPTLALKPREDVPRSPKQGYQWYNKWTCVQQKCFFRTKFNRTEWTVHEYDSITAQHKHTKHSNVMVRLPDC